MRIRMTPCLGCFAEATDSYTVTLCPTSTLSSPLEYASMRYAPVSISFSTGIFCLFSHFGHTSSEAARGRRRGSQRAARKPDTPRRNQDVARNPSVEWAAGSRFVDLAHETDSVVWGTTRMRTREAPPPSRVQSYWLASKPGPHQPMHGNGLIALENVRIRAVRTGIPG